MAQTPEEKAAAEQVEADKKAAAAAKAEADKKWKPTGTYNSPGNRSIPVVAKKNPNGTFDLTREGDVSPCVEQCPSSQEIKEGYYTPSA